MWGRYTYSPLRYFRRTQDAKLNHEREGGGEDICGSPNCWPQQVKTLGGEGESQGTILTGSGFMLTERKAGWKGIEEGD